MTEDLKSKTISGMLWSAVQRFGTMVISFIGNIILARLLTPEDFGCIGMLMVFIEVSNTFIDGGFGSAMIQKNNPTKEDCSTIFYWNLILSIFLFILLFYFAPSISVFYKIPLLCDVLRVQGVVLIVNALCMVQVNLLYKQLNFRLLAKISLISTILGSIAGIVFALLGFGVWSLVFKMLILSFVQCAALWVMSKWRPSLLFSWQSFKELFSFGGLLLLTYVLDTIYVNIQSLIIGHFFLPKELGFYTQAKKIEEIPTTSLSTVVNQVSFPVFSQLQNEREKLKTGMRKSICSISFLNFPLMILMILIAKPLMLLLFTEKWIGVIPYLQILCVWGMFVVINTGNLNLFRALRKSNIFFTVQLIKQITGLIIIYVGFQLGIWGMMWGIASTAYIAFFINSFASKKVIGYGLKEQINDISPNLLLSIFTGIIVYIIYLFIQSDLIILSIIICVSAYLVIYLVIAHFLRLEGYAIYYKLIKERFFS